MKKLKQLHRASESDLEERGKIEIHRQAAQKTLDDLLENGDIEKESVQRRLSEARSTLDLSGAFRVRNEKKIRANEAELLAEFKVQNERAHLAAHERLQLIRANLALAMRPFYDDDETCLKQAGSLNSPAVYRAKRVAIHLTPPNLDMQELPIGRQVRMFLNAVTQHGADLGLNDE